jgi:hypothetical protein
MNPTSPEPHDPHHAMPHPAEVSVADHEKHELTEHTDHASSARTIVTKGTAWR